MAQRSFLTDNIIPWIQPLFQSGQARFMCCAVHFLVSNLEMTALTEHEHGKKCGKEKLLLLDDGRSILPSPFPQVHYILSIEQN